MDDQAEQDLVRAARAGDEAAFRTLSERHAAEVRALIDRRMSAAVRRKVSALDVYQETLLVAHRRLAEFEDRGDGAFAAWLARIAELKAREAVRRFAGTAKRAAGRETSRQPGVRSEGFVGSGPSPSEVAIAGERRAEVQRALATLPPDYRRVLELVQGSGLTLREAAVLLGRSVDAAKKLYGRAVSALAAAIGVQRGARRG